jgi:hypothetical protein
MGQGRAAYTEGLSSARAQGEPEKRAAMLITTRRVWRIYFLWFEWSANGAGILW